METPDHPSPAPGQTIIIERREKISLLRRLLVPFLILTFFMMLLSEFLGPAVGLPTKLAERYYAGELTGAKVAIVEINGTILGTSADHALRQIRQARDDGQVRAVILRIDSPGGSVSDSDRLWRELQTVKKPVVASLGGMATSGGYYIAAGSDAIIAEPTTLTGSIGVILQMPQLGGLLSKLGVEMETIQTGPWKGSGSMYGSGLTDAERALWTKLIDDSYQRFLNIVAQGRRLSLEEVKSIADGRVLTVEEALNKKLVDRVGYLDDAIKDAWRRAKLESSKVVRYVRPFDLSESLPWWPGSGSGSGSGSGASRGQLPALQPWLEFDTPQRMYWTP